MLWSHLKKCYGRDQAIATFHMTRSQNPNPLRGGLVAELLFGDEVPVGLDDVGVVDVVLLEEERRQELPGHFAL